ncbi:MAG: glycosyl hydrolase family 28-related protein [Candidatus Acidiferrales bacterium]
MPGEFDTETGNQESQNTPALTTGSAGFESSSADALDRRGLIKAVGGGILGAFAATEAVARPSLAAADRDTGERARMKPAAAPVGLAGVYNVKDFGATGDGKTIDSDSINKAIEAASAAGGGTVRFPAGTYASYSVRLKSNITLELAAGSTLLAAGTVTAGGSSYDAAEPNTQWEAYQDYGHNHFHNSLIWGEGLENVSIVGPGLIHGLGLSRGKDAELPGVGNKSIALKLSRNVTLRDFSILQGGHFGILATGVDNLTIDNLRIDTNRDGMDIDCCNNVRISNCTVNSPWDDAIVLKSS